MADDSPLLAALAVIQARGAIGERSLPDAIAHADRFVQRLPTAARSLVDLGSGGGLPALVIAWRRRDLAVTMVERRASRADLLRRACISLGLGGGVRVVAEDVTKVCADHPRSFDVVTARSFATIAITLGFIDCLLAEGGSALVSEPPHDRSDSWATELGRYPKLADRGADQGIRVIARQ
ncbi:MAG TPA: RsmG family class I SAM-dependent methyltransferase [Ilumatobacteraceae bacterium]